MAILTHSLFGAVRASYCSRFICYPKHKLESAGVTQRLPPVDKCTVTSLLLVRGNTETKIRDRILLVGKDNSIAEYILPLLHITRFDPSLSDPSLPRQGLSAVKYGFPFFIPNSDIRLFLFNLGLADAIVLAPQKTSSDIDPSTIKYRFRLQPYKRRLELPPVSARLGVSEDSEVVEAFLDKNPTLFNRPFYTCL